MAADAHTVSNKRELFVRPSVEALRKNSICCRPAGFFVEFTGRNQTTDLRVHYEQMDFAVSGRPWGNFFCCTHCRVAVLSFVFY